MCSTFLVSCSRGEAVIPILMLSPLTRVCVYVCVCVCVCVFSFFWCGHVNSLYRVPRVPEQGANAPRGYDVYAALQNRRCVCQMASVRIVCFPIHQSIHSSIVQRNARIYFCITVLLSLPPPGTTAPTFIYFQGEDRGGRRYKGEACTRQAKPICQGRGVTWYWSCVWSRWSWYIELWCRTKRIRGRRAHNGLSIR